QFLLSSHSNSNIECLLYWGHINLSRDKSRQLLLEPIVFTNLPTVTSRFIKRSAPESPSAVFFSSNKKTADESAVFIIQRSRKITFSF
ncbi:hypothetical protein, partial [Vibrio owensii]|uniref:hypothetical protein n=1 Tax=Vibrio owensii TaxID=696485 RepID=UPI001D11959D